MKRLVKSLLIGLPFVASCAFSSCQGSQTEVTDSNNSDSIQILGTDSTLVSDTLQSEVSAMLERGVVLERVQTIYSLIKQECTYLGGSTDTDLLDKAFCTKSWNQLLMAVRRQEYLTNTLFFMVFTDDEKRAQVDFTVYEENSYIPARIELVYEDGQWKIDNFYHLKYMFNLRERMWEYLDGNQMAYLL